MRKKRVIVPTLLVLLVLGGCGANDCDCISCPDGGQPTKACSDGAAAPPDGPTGGDQQVQTGDLDLTDPKQNLTAFLKVRGSLDPQHEVVYYWTGYIYSFVPETSFPPKKSNKLLFRVEGFNVARFLPASDGDGYNMLSREAMFYEDPSTGKILECWNNPLNNQAVPVLHVWNDPVNFAWPASSWGNQPYQQLGDRVTWYTDLPLAYPSPLAGNPVYANYSAGDLYQTAELFNFFTSYAELADPEKKSVSVEISWTKVGQYVPFMQMGAQPGSIIYHTRGKKLNNGWQDLPQHIRDYVLARKPEYQHAPTTWAAGQKNMTSWRYFKALYDSGKYSSSCK